MGLAIVLHSRVFFEKDRLVEVFSENAGRIRFLNRRGSQITSMTSARLDAITLVSLELSKGKSFYYLNRCRLENAFLTIKSEYNRLTMALYFCDIIRKASSEEQENQELFLALKQAFYELEQGKDLYDLKSRFERQFLRLEGLIASEELSLTTEEFSRIFQDYTARELRQPDQLIQC